MVTATAPSRQGSGRLQGPPGAARRRYGAIRSGPDATFHERACGGSQTGLAAIAALIRETGRTDHDDP